MKTSELIKMLVDRLLKVGDLPTNIKDYTYPCCKEGEKPSKLILLEEKIDCEDLES